MILKQLIKYDNAPVIEATWADENGVIVKCHAYGVAEFDDLVADLGAEALKHRALIAEVEATYVPPEPEPATPTVCSPAQGLVALFAIKQITESDVNATIAAITDPVARYTSQVAFARATEWRRDSASMQQLATLLGLTESDLDALFAFAVTVAV